MFDRSEQLAAHGRHASQAAQAPAFLTTPKQNPDRLVDVKPIPYARAYGDLVYELDTQAALVAALAERLMAVLEDPTPMDPCSTDPCPYSSARAVEELAGQVQRVRVLNTQLQDLIARLAI